MCVRCYISLGLFLVMTGGLHGESGPVLKAEGGVVRSPTAAVASDRPVHKFSQTMQTLMGQQGDRSYATRLGAFRSLPPNLTFRETLRLQIMVTEKEWTNGLSGIQEKALLNKIFVRLRQQNPYPPHLDQTFITIVEDHTRTDGLRGYAVQHLTQLLPKLEAKEAALDCLVQCVTDNTPGVPGSTVLGLFNVWEDVRQEVSINLIDLAQQVVNSVKVTAGDKASARAVLHQIQDSTKN